MSPRFYFSCMKMHDLFRLPLARIAGVIANTVELIVDELKRQALESAS